MPTHHRFLSVLTFASALFAMFTLVSQTQAQLTISASPTAPTVDSADIANLASPIANDFGSSFIWPDRPARGQTFLTGNSAGDFTLDAITLQASEDALPTNGYTLRIGAVTGNAFTPISTATGSFATNINANEYVTFALNSPVSLTANTTYGFDVALGTTDGGFGDHGWQLRNSAQTGYADGSAYSSGSNAVGGATINTHNQDRIFHLNLAPGMLPPPPTPEKIANYTFDGGSFASTAVEAGWTTSDLSNGAGVPLGTNGGQGNPAPSLELSFGDVGANLSQSLAGDDYYTFSVTPDDNASITYTDLTFDFFKTANAGANVTASLFSDIDGFDAADIIDEVMLSGGGESGAFFARTFDLDSLPDDLVDPVEFRIYIDDAGASNQSNQFRLDNIMLNGIVQITAVPEPGSIAIWALVGLGLVGGGAWRIRRKV